MSDFELRTGAMPAIDPCKCRVTLYVKDGLKIPFGGGNKLAVTAINGLRVAGATEKRTQQDLSSRCALGPL